MQIKREEAKKVVAKLKFSPPRKTHHSIHWFYHKGKKILKTRISKGRGDFKATDKFRGQLKLNEKQLRETVDCTFNYEDYVRLLAQKGLIQQV